MKQVLILGATGGLGQALSQAHGKVGWQVTGLSRRDGLELTDPEAVQRCMAGLDGPYSRIIVATGALEIAGARPEKSLAQITAQAMADQFSVNTIGPALVLQQVGRLMDRRAPGVVAVMSARVGSIGDNRLGGWHSYRASKAALNQILRGAAIELARTHRQVAAVALHPGTVATAFTERYAARHARVAPDQAAGHLLAVMDGLDAEDTGKFFDWSGAEVPW